MLFQIIKLWWTSVLLKSAGINVNLYVTNKIWRQKYYNYWPWNTIIEYNVISNYYFISNIFFSLTSFFFFLAFDFCRLCMVIRFFHPRHNGQWPPTLKDFYARSYPLHYFLILILEKKPVFPFWILSAKQGNYWYHFYYVFGMMRSLTGDWTRDLLHSKPALYH